MTQIFTLHDFDWPVSPILTHAHAAGHVIDVSDDCAVYALAKGFAKLADLAEDDLFELPHQDDVSADDDGPVIY